MIEKERLKELIEKRIDKLFYVTNNKVYTMIMNKDNVCLLDKMYERYVCEKRNGQYNLFNMFETKEEAEFALKYYTKKTIKFEPPTFESVSKLLETKEDKMFIIIRIRTYKLIITRFCNTNLLSIINVVDNLTGIDDYGEFTKENYYKALDRMKEKFLKEEEI